MNFSNYSELYKFVESKIDEADVFTFDIFDTLVHRYVSPNCVLDALFYHISSFIKLNFDLDLTEKEISDYRHLAYVNVAKKYETKGLDFEVDYTEFLSEWSKLITSDKNYSNEIFNFIKNKEREFECLVTYQSNGILPVLDLIKKSGKPIFLISDMYLSQSIIEDILLSCGYDLNFFDGIYVSSEEKLLKRTGNLFRKFLSNYPEVRASKVFHFGDNELADGVMATEAGLQGIVIRDNKVFEQYDEKDVIHKRYLEDKSYIAAYISSLYQIHNENRDEIRSSIGGNLLGPILSSFCHKILLDCKKHGINKVYFCAREGAVIKEVFDRVSLSFDLPVTSFYLHTSRLSSFQASLHQGIKNFHIKNAISNTGNYSIRSIFKPFGLPESILIERASLYGIGCIDSVLPHDFENWSPYLNLVNDPKLNEMCLTLGRQVNENFIDYLDDLQFFDDSKVALVDVGWSGQIQNNIYNAIKDHSNVEIHGYYCGSRAKSHEISAPRSSTQWVFADESHLGWFGSPALQEVFITETLTRACHPTVIGYQKVDLKTVPIFKPVTEDSRVVEAIFDPSLAVIQHSAASYASFYSIVNKLFSFDAEFCVRYGRLCLDRLVRFPSKEMVSLFQDISNVSDLGSDDIHSLLTGKSGRLSIKQIPNSLWPYGQSVFFGGFVSLAYSFRRALRYQPTFPRQPNFDEIKIIRKVPSEKSKLHTTSSSITSISPEWDDIVTLNNAELLERRIFGNVSLDRKYILKTSLLYISTKIVRKLMKKNHNYYNDSFSVKELLKKDWFK